MICVRIRGAVVIILNFNGIISLFLVDIQKDFKADDDFVIDGDKTPELNGAIKLDNVSMKYEGEEKYETATAMKMEIVSAMEKELVLENMVKSLGFSDAVVSVSADSDNVNVFINSSELNYDTALSIYSMMKGETGIVAGNIIIMPVYAES